MKLIYINVEPFLRACLEGPPPLPPAVPLAVSVPYGEQVAIVASPDTIVPDGSENDEGIYDLAEINGVSVSALPDLGRVVLPANGIIPASDKWRAYAVEGDEVTLSLYTGYNNKEAESVDPVVAEYRIRINRQAPEGPVDLIDWTPGVTAADINTALGGTGATPDNPLAGVSLDGARAYLRVGSTQLYTAQESIAAVPLEIGPGVSSPIGTSSGS